MKLPEGAVALALCLILTAIALISSSDEDEDEEINRQFGGGEPPPEPAEKDEWDTEEPYYEVPAWHMPEGKVQTLEFGGGDMNDADRWSDHMPFELKCDGCRAIAYAIRQKLKKFQKRYRERHIFSESDVVELMDQVCQNKKGELDGYGVKEIMGKRRLSGPGLETMDVPGVSHSGGKWAFRLQQMCKEYVNEIGEYTIYKRFLRHKSMENVLCRNKRSELGWMCPKKIKRRRKKEQQPQQEEGEVGVGEGQSQQAPVGEKKEALPQDPATESEQAAEDAKQEENKGQPEDHHTQTEDHHTQIEDHHAQPEDHHAKPEDHHAQPEDHHAQPEDHHAQPEDHHAQPEDHHAQPAPGEDGKQNSESGTKSEQDSHKRNAEDGKKSVKDEKAEDAENEKSTAKPDATKPKAGKNTVEKEELEIPKDDSKEEAKGAVTPDEDADKKAKTEDSRKYDGDAMGAQEGRKEYSSEDAKENTCSQPKEEKKAAKEEL